MNEIILYSTPTCGQCKYIKKLLIDSGVDFKENNSQEEMIQKGILSLPALEINGKLLAYNDVLKWIVERNK